MLAMAYCAMIADGSIRQVFHQAEPDIKWFLSWMTEQESVIIGAYRKQLESDAVTLCGMGFINSIQRLAGLTKAEVGFSFWSPMAPMIFMKAELVRRMLDYAFEFSGLDSLTGLTPERNPGAVAMIRRVGMRVFGPVPRYCSWHGEACGAYISQMDAESWLNRQP
jgi:RimJ/RimL family protein N-acetyltransferase